MTMNNEKGIALVMTLLIVVVLIVLGSVFTLRTINEWAAASAERRQTQAFYLAEGGAHAGLDQIDTLINNYMLNTISASNPQVVISTTQNYVASGDGLGFLDNYVEDGGTPQLTISGSEATNTISTVSLGDGSYGVNIIITEKSNPAATGFDEWQFPYFFRLESTGQAGNIARKVLLVGDFTVSVQRDNFAKYALFTNQQSMPNGTRVWFTDKTNFAGPLHTNDRYNIALNPSATFDGSVTQYQETARFYNQGWPVLLDAESNGTRDVPSFNSGFIRDAEQIALSSAVQKQDMIDQALASDTISGDGIYVPNDGVQLTGGIYVEGDADVSLNTADVLDGGGVVLYTNSVYTVTQAGTTKVITVDETANSTTIQTVGIGTENFVGVPDGVLDVGTIIYVNGDVDSLSGTIQEDSELTIASENDIVVTDHVRYSKYKAAVNSPGDAGYEPPYVATSINDARCSPGCDPYYGQNLLGIVSWNGDVRVGTSAPDNVDLHGTILAQNGIFSVDNYFDQGVGDRGTATLLGGVITDYYGAFGLFNGSTGQQIAGYGRNFVYDNRMEIGNAPPYFPSLNTFIAFTNDIIDKITLQEGGF